jgi:BASS family bile acid:Na+ symporter
MDIKTLLSSFAQITVFAVMLSMGMALGFQGITRLWRRPSLLLRCLVAAFGVVPLAAMAVVYVLPLTFEVRAGIAAMAVIPGAPFIYRKMLKGPSDAELAGSFQATMVLLSIVLVPLWFGILSMLYPNDAAAPLATVFKQVMLIQGVPLLAGAAISQWLPDFTDDFDEPLNRISTAMLIAVVLLVLVVGLPLVLKAGVLPVVAVTVMAAVALLSGHFLGGVDPVSRQTIAIANATRNAGLAIALITLNFPNAAHEILITIAAYAVISGIAAKIYARLYQKRLAQVTETPRTMSG